MLEKYWEEDAIQAAPVYTLSECAALNTKYFDEEDLSDMTALTNGLIERFRSALFVCDEEQFDLICDVMAMSAGKRPFTQMPPGGFYTFYRNGFVYLFSWEGNDYLVLPDELAEIYNKVLLEADFAATSKHRSCAHMQKHCYICTVLMK